MAPFAEPKTSPRGKVQIANPVPSLGPNIRITSQSRYYAVAELCRRAGIPREFFRTWKFSFTPQQSAFEISNGTTKYITFPHASQRVLQTLAAGQLSSVNVPLDSAMPLAAPPGISYCPVPFVAGDMNSDKPLFYLADENHLECSVDLPLSILLTLSRWEETQDSRRDSHSRFRAEHSIATTGGFLERPIVDEYGLAFEQAMGLLFPSWKKTQRKLRIKLSHDADHVGIPFRWRTAVRHSVRSRVYSQFLPRRFQPPQRRPIRQNSTR